MVNLKTEISLVSLLLTRNEKNSDITPLDGIKITRIRDKHQMAVYYLCKYTKKKNALQCLFIVSHLRFREHCLGCYQFTMRKKNSDRNSFSIRFSITELIPFLGYPNLLLAEVVASAMCLHTFQDVETAWASTTSSTPSLVYLLYVSFLMYWESNRALKPTKMFPILYFKQWLVSKI